MCSSMRRTVLLFVLLFAAGFCQQDAHSQLTDFCRRFFHRTAVVGNKLFIDSGYINYGGSISLTTVNETNTHLLYADLTRLDKYDFFPQQYDNLSKPATAPSEAGGTVWTDSVNEQLYFYGGGDGVWSYDVLNNVWSALDSYPYWLDVAQSGASATQNEKGIGYYYGGWNASNGINLLRKRPSMS